jgi:hypothetical protein
MSDDNTTPETAATPDQGLAPAVETFSREYVTELRNEAAKARTDKKSAVEVAKAERDTEWQEQVNASQAEQTRLQTELGDSWVELQKLHSAISAGVPTDKLLAFASVLKGSTADELDSAAKSAKDLFGGFNKNDPATDPTQGSGGRSPLALNSDALLQAVKSAVGA